MNSPFIFIDVGSSSVKVYKYSNNNLKLILTKSIPFKERFTKEKGISNENKFELLDLIIDQKTKNPNSKILIFATAIFRKLNKSSKLKFQKEFLDKTKIKFNIISQKEENDYLEAALISKYKSKDPVLLVNIGGGSTELVIVRNSKVIEKKNVDIGIGAILSEFEGINDKISKVKLEVVVGKIVQRLPNIRTKVKTAFYTGGELNYMKLAKYKLRKNNLFKDKDHPSIINFKNFQNRNKEVFEKVTLNNLENLMQKNPKWMHGARACSAFAQGIFEKYGIEIIIPSDSNLINGVVRKEFY